MSGIYDKIVAVKPEVRDILWAYKRKGDLGECVNKIEELMNDVWNYAIEDAAKLAETHKGYPTPVSENILRLKL